MRLIERSPAARYGLAIVAPAVATATALGIGSARTTAAALVYILAVLAIATIAGLASALIASVLSFLALNFFFTPPRHTFRVSKGDDLVALVVFIAVAMVVSTLVARSLTLRARAERREYESRSLYAISSRMLAGEPAEAGGELARVLADVFGLARCEVKVEGAETIAVGESITARSIEIPMIVGTRTVGSLALFPGELPFDEAERRVATVFAGQIGSSLERARLEREAREAQLASEGHRVRSALLSAVSHDFRTPLASIKAAITALLPGRDESDELLRTALEETERLERIVSNLLDLTRIRSGSLSPDRAPVRVEDLVDDVLAAARRALDRHSVQVRVRDETPVLMVDPVQIGQALRNVVENAAKFSPPGKEIAITAARWHADVEIRIADRGPGIPSSERHSVFDEFYRAGDGRTAGTGLGLAIAKAIVGANGGRIWIEETPGGGATVAFRLPSAERAA